MKKVKNEAKNAFIVDRQMEISYTSDMSVKPNSRTQEYRGKKLREIREKRGLFQEDVAKAVGISTTYYASMERGLKNPTESLLEKLCQVLKIKSSDILPF